MSVDFSAQFFICIKGVRSNEVFRFSKKSDERCMENA